MHQWHAYMIHLYIHLHTQHFIHASMRYMHECIHPSIDACMYKEQHCIDASIRIHCIDGSHPSIYTYMYILPYIGGWEWEGYLLIAKCRGPSVPIDDTLPNLDHILWWTDGRTDGWAGLSKLCSGDRIDDQEAWIRGVFMTRITKIQLQLFMKRHHAKETEQEDLKSLFKLN